jgi:redox-sensitive bicupin YhaK (pirin superfamily)
MVSGRTLVPQNALAVMEGDGNLITTKAGTAGARLLVVAGKAIGEPIVQSGPFVMNTRAEIEQAFSDFQNGTLVKRKASMRASSR